MKAISSLRPDSQRSHGRVRGGRFWLPVILGILVSTLTIAACGTQRTELPTPAATLRPTFTATVLPSPTPAPLTPTHIATPSAVPTAVLPSDTVAAEPSATNTPGPTQTPRFVTATPSPTRATPTPRPPTATPVPAKPARMDSPEYGMQAFLWWRPEVAQRDLGEIRKAGFGWVKQAFAWRDIEGRGKGAFDWSITDRIVDQVESVGGLSLIARLDTDPAWASGQTYPNPGDVLMTPPADNKDLADFCFAVASRYRGRIAAYQVWNEPNLSREWGGKAPDPAGYVALLRACYQAIKRADPSAIVISAGLAPTTRFDQVAMPDTEFLRRMYVSGAKPYFDALGAHGAGYKAPPEKDPGEVATDPNYYNVGDVNCPGAACRIYCFRHVEDLRQIMVDGGDTSKQIVVLEFGWTIDPRPDSPYRWHAVTEEQQADYLVRAYGYAKQHWQPWIGVMSLIYMPDPDWTKNDEQFWWSIAVPNYPAFIPRQAYRDLAVMSK